MKAWFFGLQPRERWIVIAGVVAAAVIVLWGLVLKPLGDLTTELRASVELKQRLLADVTRVEAARPGQVAVNLEGTGQTLLVVVSNTAPAHGLGQPRTRQNGPSGIDVTLQAASFDSLVAWLITLRGTYGVDVESASFNSAREPGLVNGQVSLRRL
jgi:general secretion pathway protein M